MKVILAHYSVISTPHISLAVLGVDKVQGPTEKLTPDDLREVILWAEVDVGLAYELVAC